MEVHLNFKDFKDYQDFKDFKDFKRSPSPLNFN